MKRTDVDILKLIPDREIQCKYCGITKHAREFRHRKKDNGVTLDNKMCKKCHLEQKAIIRRYKIKYSPPLDSKCDCCGKIERLVCDHSHGSKKEFRGWLCNKCNVGIGYLGDTIDDVKNALSYLTRVSEMDIRV